MCSEKKRFFREPIPEIIDAARLLDAAVSAHMIGRSDLAKELFLLADDPKVREWTESIWGKGSPYVKVTKSTTLKQSSVDKIKSRMPSTEQKKILLQRDGYHCRYCGIPVIRAEVRKYLHKLYPNEIPWGASNISQHAAFQCMWAQYDHVIPHSLGGTNGLENLVISCAPCNYGKMDYSLEELCLLDPRNFPPKHTEWDGLERVLTVH